MKVMEANINNLPNIYELFALWRFNPDNSKYNMFIETLDINNRVFLAYIDNGIAGALVIKESGHEMEIIGIGVLDSYRKLGVGKALVYSLLSKVKPENIFAETDDESLGFYKSIGFKVKELGNIRGYERYKCYLEFHNSSFCGVNCHECPVFIATKNDDDKLRQAVADKWSKLYGKEFHPEDINCNGCKVEEGKFHLCKSCYFEKCLKDKSISSCLECSDYICERLGSLYCWNGRNGYGI